MLCLDRCQRNIVLSLRRRRGEGEVRNTKGFRLDRYPGQNPRAKQHQLTRQTTPIAIKVNWKDWDVFIKIGILKLVLVTATLGLSLSGVLAQPPNAPFAGGPKLTVEQSLKEAPKADKSLLPLDKAFYAAEAKLKKSPKDAKVKNLAQDIISAQEKEIALIDAWLKVNVK